MPQRRRDVRASTRHRRGLADVALPLETARRRTRPRQSIRRRYAEDNLPIVGVRGAALLNLAATMPLAPLCDLTGMSTNVAARWRIVAASAYAEYPAIRL